MRVTRPLDRHAIADREGNAEEHEGLPRVLGRLAELMGAPSGGWPALVAGFRTETRPSPSGFGPDLRSEVGWLRVTDARGEVVDPAALVDAARRAARAARSRGEAPRGRFRDGPWPSRPRRRRRRRERAPGARGWRLRSDAALAADVAEGAPLGRVRRSAVYDDPYEEGPWRRPQRCWKENRRIRWRDPA